MIDRFPMDFATLDHVVDIAGKIADIIAKVGFPIVVAGWLLFRHEQLEVQNLMVLQNLRGLCEQILRKGCGHGQD